MNITVAFIYNPWGHNSTIRNVPSQVFTSPNALYDLCSSLTSRPYGLLRDVTQATKQRGITSAQTNQAAANIGTDHFGCGDPKIRENSQAIEMPPLRALASSPKSPTSARKLHLLLLFPVEFDVSFTLSPSKILALCSNCCCN
uniref:Mediator of RNA polymerase II transcription subunit 19 n=1 Tax=Ascaris lumbricoides TaxID=6252 RepID=A0A0M3IE12_ASCLU